MGRGGTAGSGTSASSISSANIGATSVFDRRLANSSSTRAFSSCMACRSDPRASSSATGSGSLTAAPSFEGASAAVELLAACGFDSSEAGSRVDEVALAGTFTILSEPASTTTLLAPGLTGGRLWSGPLAKLLPSRARSMRWPYLWFAASGAIAAAPAGDASGPGDGVVALLGLARGGVEGASQSSAGSERAVRFECALITLSCRVAISLNFLSAPLTDLQYTRRTQAQMHPMQARRDPTAAVTETTSTTGKLLP